MRTLTGTERHQNPVNLEVRLQDPDPELDYLAPVLLSSLCQSGLFNNRRDAAICARFPAAIVLSSAQNIFVDTSNPSTARPDRTYARSLVAQPPSRVEITCVTTTGHILIVEAEKGRTQSTAFQNSKSSLGQKRRSLSGVSDRSKNSMRRRRSSRSRKLRSQATPRALGCKLAGQ